MQVDKLDSRNRLASRRAGKQRPLDLRVIGKLQLLLSANIVDLVGQVTRPLVPYGLGLALKGRGIVVPAVYVAAVWPRIKRLAPTSSMNSRAWSEVIPRTSASMRAGDESLVIRS